MNRWILALAIFISAPAASAVELALGPETLLQAETGQRRLVGGGFGFGVDLRGKVHDALHLGLWADVSRAAYPDAHVAFGSVRLGTRIQTADGRLRPFLGLFLENVFDGTRPSFEAAERWRVGEELGLELIGSTYESSTLLRFGVALRAAQPVDVNAPDTPFLNLGLVVSAKVAFELGRAKRAK